MDHLSTLTLHKLRYGELSSDDERAARDHMDTCERCAGLLQRQENARAAFELKPVPKAILDAARPSPWWQRALDAVGGWQPAVALAAALFLGMVLVGPQVLGPGAESDTIRTRYAGAAVEVLVEGQGLLEPGQTLDAGDRVQLRIAPGPWRHAWVGDGQQMYSEFDLVAGKATLAPFSLTLDDAQQDEEIVVVLSERALEQGTLNRALRGESIDGVRVVTRTLHRDRAGSTEEPE